MNDIKNIVFFIICSFLTIHPNVHAKPKIDLLDLIEADPVRADYVIVGVGTAGAVLAKELSDNPGISVIALHTGKNLTQDPDIKFSRNVFTTVASTLAGLPPFSESGDTVPQVNANNRELPWVLALPLGGTSSVNAGAWARGTSEVYAQWEALAGPEWSVPRIFAIYQALENYQGFTTNPVARGFFGPLNVRQVPDPTLVSLKFTQAIINETGVPLVLDYNDPLTPIGASPQFQYTQKGPNGAVRVSSAVAFLNKNVMTPSGRGVDGRQLRVLFKSTGLRTIWQGNTAVGVEYLRHGKKKKVYANRGVIVCAGLKSSFFLMHSGVGPASVLTSLGIPVVFDNPNVGQGLADQPGLPLLFKTNPNDTPCLNNNSLFSQIAWLPAPGGDPTIRELRFSTINQVPGTAVALFDLVQPRSRGVITLNSADPLDPPVINFSILSNPIDLDLYQLGLQIYVKNINAALQALDPEYQLIFPDPTILNDINLVTQFIREGIQSNQSFQSHCRMAPLSQGGVVNSTGRVYGVQNLIVADDSIVPQAMDGATMASAYLIAANIARLLLSQ